MFWTNLERQGQIEAWRRLDERRAAERWRLARAAQPESWLHRQMCRFLCGMGRALVRTGQQLQQVGSAGERLAEPSTW